MRHRTRFWGALGAGVIALSCGLPAALYAQEGIDRIREKSLEFYQALGQKALDTYMKGRSSDFDRVYKTYHYLTTPDKIAEVRSFLPTANEEQKSAYELLARFLTYESIRQGSAPEVDGGNNYLSDTEIVVDTEEIPLRDVLRRMGAEPDRSARRKWSFAFKEFLENVNVYRRQTVHLSNRAAQGMGFKDYLDFLTTYKDLDMAAATARAETLIEGSNDLYATLFAEQVQATYQGEMEPNQVRFYDVPRIFAMSRFDEGLQPRRAPQQIEKALERFGFKLDGGDKGTIDVEQTEEPHAVSGVVGYLNSPVRNIATIAIKPTTGFRTYSGMLFESGRLFYHARAGGAYYEHHFFGDPTASFAVGYLFQNLLGNAEWLGKNTKLEESDISAVQRAFAFDRLFRAREYAARTKFLPQIYEGIKQPEDAFEAVFEPIRLWGHTEVDRILYMETNDEFDCVAHVRAMIIAVGLERMLENRFGPTWFENPEVANALAAWWSKGQRQSTADYAASVDVAALDPTVLIEDISTEMNP